MDGPTKKRIKAIDHRTEVFYLRIDINKLLSTMTISWDEIRNLKNSIDALELSICGHFEDFKDKLKKEMKELDTINKKIESVKITKLKPDDAEAFIEELKKKYGILSKIMKPIGYIQKPEDTESYGE